VPFVFEWPRDFCLTLGRVATSGQRIGSYGRPQWRASILPVTRSWPSSSVASVVNSTIAGHRQSLDPNDHERHARVPWVACYAVHAGCHRFGTPNGRVARVAPGAMLSPFGPRDCERWTSTAKACRGRRPLDQGAAHPSRPRSAGVSHPAAGTTEGLQLAPAAIIPAPVERNLLALAPVGGGVGDPRRARLDPRERSAPTCHTADRRFG
jgi:hypothetical protein